MWEQLLLKRLEDGKALFRQAIWEHIWELTLGENHIQMWQQCNFASVRADNLKRHLISHSREKSIKVWSEEFYSIWILWIHVGDLQFFLRIPFVFGHVRKRLVGGQKENRRLFSQVQFLLPNNGNSGNLMMSTEKSWVWIPKILGQSDRGLGALGTDLLVGWVDLWRRKTKKKKETHLQCAAQASRPSPAWRPSPSWSWSWFRSWPWPWSWSWRLGLVVC